MHTMCIEEIPPAPYYVKRFECPEKRYINVTDYYYYYYYYNKDSTTFMKKLNKF